MCPRTWASSFPPTHSHYARMMRTVGLEFNALHNHGMNLASVANLYYASPIEIPFRCRIERIGFIPTVVITGNVKLGFHGSDVTLLPNAKLCETAAIAAGALTGAQWYFTTPTTTPIINPGYYYVGHICDTDYVAATSGINFDIMQTDGGFGIGWNDGISGIYQQAVGAFNVPDPMVEVASANARILGCAIRVSIP